MTTGLLLRQDGLLIGVYAIQLPPEYERSIEEMSAEVAYWSTKIH